MSEIQQDTLSKCIKCDSELIGNFCHNCGHPIELKRINGRYILKEISTVLNFDKGILYTIRELTLRPGKSVQVFINNERNRLVKPIIFLIITSLIYTIVQRIFHFEDGYINYNDVGDNGTVTNQIFSWIANNYGYANILMAIFISFWIKIFNRKQSYNYFEYFVLLCFIMGMGMLIFTVFGVVDVVFDVKLMQFGVWIAFFYCAWAIGQFIGKKKFGSYLLAFLSYILGMLSFFIVSIVAGILIDILLN